MKEQNGLLFKWDRDAREYFAGGAEVKTREGSLRRVTIHPMIYIATGVANTLAWNIARQRLVCTDLIRRYQEQDSIYSNHTSQSVRERYERNPWTSVHEVGRAKDFGVLYEKKPHGVIRNDHWTHALVETANQMFVYDPARKSMKCFVYKHKSTNADDPSNIGHGSHIHVQVHPNTVFLGDAIAIRP